MENMTQDMMIQETNEIKPFLQETHEKTWPNKS